MIKKAFTLVELILVIVILGVVMMMGSSILSDMYSDYYTTRSISALETKTELALEFIAKKLSYRIKGSVATFDTPGITGNIQSLENSTLADNHTLMWIGISNESSLGEWNAAANRYVPGWSSFIDMDASNAATRTISTPGSHLNLANHIINALSDNAIGFNVANRHPAIIFKNRKDIDITQYYSHTNTDYTTVVNSDGANNFTVPATEGLANHSGGPLGDLYEQYYLAHTAYAIVPEGADTEDFTLNLKFNFQPWNNDNLNNNTPSAIIAEHVSTFRFMQTGGALRIKLCIQDGSKTFSACKETAVF